MTKPHSTSASKNSHVKITVTGSGTNIWAYAIANETYSRIAEDAQDEDPADVIMAEYQAGQLVCWGIDPSGNCTVTIEIEDKKIHPRIVRTYDGYSIAEALKSLGISKSAPFIEFNSDQREELGSVFDLSNLNHVYLDAVTWKNITLHLELPITARNFDQRKLTLLACDMDTETELAELSYQNDLLDGLEEDIIGVIYDGKKYFFESHSSNATHQERSMLSRTSDGWKINDQVDF